MVGEVSAESERKGRERDREREGERETEREREMVALGSIGGEVEERRREE